MEILPLRLMNIATAVLYYFSFPIAFQESLKVIQTWRRLDNREEINYYTAHRLACVQVPYFKIASPSVQTLYSFERGGVKVPQAVVCAGYRPKTNCSSMRSIHKKVHKEISEESMVLYGQTNGSIGGVA